MKVLSLFILISLLCAHGQAKKSLTSSYEDVYVTFTSSNDPTLNQGIYRYTRMTSYFNRPAIYFKFVNKETGVNECLVFYDYKKSIVQELTFYADRYMMSTTRIPTSALDEVEVIDLDILLPTWTREEAYHYFWSLNDKRVWVIDKSNLGRNPKNPLVLQTMPGVFHQY